MQRKLKYSSVWAIYIFALGLFFVNSTSAQTTQNWKIIVPSQLQNEESIKIALNDLQTRDFAFKKVFVFL